MKVVVVGAGISGLVAALRAKMEGFDVVILEQNEKCGGLVNSFWRDGYLFDGGTRALQTFILSLLKPLEIEIEYVKTPVSLGIEDKIISMESVDSIEDYRKLLEELYPDSKKDIARIFKDVWKMGKFLASVNKMLAIRKGVVGFLADFLPAFVGMMANMYVLVKMKAPMEEYFDKKIRVKNASLKNIITQHFFAGNPTFFALGYLYLYPDYMYPLGGTGKLAEKLEEKVRSYGIEVKTRARVVRVDAFRKYVETENGEKMSYDALIWAADLKALYRNISLGSFSQNIIKEFEREKEKFLSHKGAESIFTLYLAVDEDPEYFRRKSHAHFFYTPSRTGIGRIVTEELNDLIQNWERLDKKDIFDWLYRLCKYTTYEIAIPVLKDQSAAPSKKTGLIVSFLFDYTLAKKAKETSLYDELKEKAMDFVIQVLSETIYPNLKDKIIFKFAATPLTIESISGSSEGSVIGWSMSSEIPVTASFLRMVEAPKTTVPDVLKVGQWTLSPAGTPTAVLTGNLAIDFLKKQQKARKK